MSTQTPNLNLDLREGTDIFNPLSTNANFETLDSVITEIRKKGGVPTYTTTASANLLKLSENPVPNETLFKFVAAGDANTWSYQETVNNIVTMDGNQKTVKGGEMYVAWVNAANSMVVIAWPDVVNAQTFDGKGPAEWASKAQLDAVNQTAVNATTTAQAAATVANNALGVAQAAGMKIETIWTNPTAGSSIPTLDNLELDIPSTAKAILITIQRGGSYLYANENFSGRIFTMDMSSGNIVQYERREITINNNKLTLGTGLAYRTATYDTATTGNWAAVPTKIYAIS
jgi:hypothetical protein